MTIRSTTALAAFAGAVLAALPAAADDRAVVRAFYERILSHPSAPDLAQRVDAVLAPNWVTLGNNTGGNDRAYFTKAIQGFGQAVPDLKWEIQEILAVGERYVVRGRATGTPGRTFLGVEPNGRSFDVMSIDIHTVENGRIVRSYHVEDWAGAIRQLRAP